MNVVIQKEQVVLNVGAASTESLSNGNLDFPEKQVTEKRQILNWLCLFTYGSLNAVVLVRGHSPC